MKKHNESDNIKNLFKNISEELFPEFSSFSNFYTFWCFNFLNKQDDTPQKLNELYAQYQKIPEQEDSIQNLKPINIIRKTSNSQREPYDDPFSHLTDIEKLQLSQKLQYIKDTSQFQALVKQGYSNIGLWHYFMWKYFIEEHTVIYSILSSSYNTQDENVIVSEEEFLYLCSSRRAKYQMREICDIDKDDFKKILRLLADMHSDIEKLSDNKFRYPKSMQDSIIECIAIPYDGLTEYPSSSLLSLKKYLQRIQNTSKDSSKEEQILNWKDDNKYYSFDIFTGANQRLFLEKDVSLKAAENWTGLTGSLINNCIYKTLLEVNNHYRFISSRMDNSILEKLYLCLEKSLNICNLNYLEKLKFIQRIYSLIPLFLERTESDESGKADTQENNFSEINTASETPKNRNTDNPIKQHEKLEAVFQSLANAIEDFNIDLIIENYKQNFKKPGKGDLLKEYKSTIDKTAENIRMLNKAFVKMYSQSQKGEKDTARNKNALFYQKISKGVLYIIYS